MALNPPLTSASTSVLVDQRGVDAQAESAVGIALGDRQQLDHVAQAPGESDVGRLELFDPLDGDVALATRAR